MGGASSKIKEGGPVFLQWIDCVWQVSAYCTVYLASFLSKMNTCRRKFYFFSDAYTCSYVVY